MKPSEERPEWICNWMIQIVTSSQFLFRNCISHISECMDFFSFQPLEWGRWRFLLARAVRKPFLNWVQQICMIRANFRLPDLTVVLSANGVLCRNLISAWLIDGDIWRIHRGNAVAKPDSKAGKWVFATLIYGKYDRGIVVAETDCQAIRGYWAQQSDWCRC